MHIVCSTHEKKERKYAYFSIVHSFVEWNVCLTFSIYKLVSHFTIQSQQKMTCSNHNIWIYECFADEAWLWLCNAFSRATSVASKKWKCLIFVSISNYYVPECQDVSNYNLFKKLIDTLTLYNERIGLQFY